MRAAIAASSSNEAERKGMIAATPPRAGANASSTPAWARCEACTIACTRAIIRSWRSALAWTDSPSRACSIDASHGRQRDRRASHTTTTRPLSVGALGGAVIGCRPTTSARERSIAATGPCLIEVTSSHRRPASRPPDRRT